ncbi:hypothetical protein RRG08_019585 [Elysia crispata]|uniref:Uncharacterized protein n=1 Tax=Elysia crispata TaxID=231223 RepID=A0AAE1BAH9_9GAST|nr:hypothetical protein RRG08_019585 [Elysia crispata]
MSCPGILFTKILMDRLGQKWTGVASAALINAGLLGSAWTVKVSVIWTAVLMGGLVGWAVGINLFVVIQNVSGWSPKRAPIFMATTISFSSALSMVQNQLITVYVNPENLKPDVDIGPNTYFSQPKILARVPNVIIIYACVTLCLQFIGYSMMTTPPKSPDHSSSSNSLDLKKSELDELSRDQNGHARTSESLQTSDGQVEKPEKKHYGSRAEYIDQSHISKALNGTVKSTNPVVENGHGLSSESTMPEGQPRSRSMDTCKVLKTPEFYALFFFSIAICFAFTLKCNYYKQFGLLYIHDDHFLTLAGTLLPIASTSARLLYGMLIDRCIISIKDSIVFTLALNAFLCAFWFFVPQINATLYIIWIMLLAIPHSSFYVVFPTGCLWTFGPENFSTNYGLLNTSDLFVGFLGPLIITSILHTLGWATLFAVTCGFSIFALVFTLFADFNRLN